MAQSPLDILNAAGIESLGRGQSGQQQPMQQAPQGGLPPVKPSTSQTKSILENEIARLTGEEDDIGSLKQLADERKKEREKLQKFYNEFQPSDAEKFLAIGQGLLGRVPRGGGQSSIAASVANAAGLVAPVVSKQEQLKQAYRLKAMEMGYAAADEAYNESLTQKRDIQKLLMQEQIKGMGSDSKSTFGKTMRDLYPNLQPGTPEYEVKAREVMNYLYGSASGKTIASGDPRIVALATNPQYIQEKKQVEDEFDNASTRAAYGPNGAAQWEADRQAKLDALQQRYIGMGAGASNLVPGAPRSEPSAPGIIPPPSPMNQAPSAPNVVPGAGVSAAVQQAESGGNTKAVSPKGAQGSMQLMPGTAKDLGVDPTNPVENAAGGEKYLSGLRAKYGNDVYALAAYNWGPGNVDKWVKEGANLDKLPTETKNYIDRVRKLAGPNFVELNAAGAPSTPAAAPSATVQTATAPSVAPSLTTTAKPSARPFITPAQEAAVKEKATAIGKAEGEAVANLPKAESAAKDTLKTILEIDQHPGKAQAVGKSAMFLMQKLPFTEAGGFMTKLSQTKDKSFLQAFESLRGGGQITEVEGIKATNAINRLNNWTSEAEFQTALDELKEITYSALEKSYKQAGKPVPENFRSQIDAQVKPTPRSKGFAKKAPVNKAVQSQFSIVNEQK
jgi:hypothetical protein